MLAVAALVALTDCLSGNETSSRESRQSDIFSPALGIGKPSGAKRRAGGSIKYKKVSVKTVAATAAVSETVPPPDSTTAKPNKTRRLKPKTSNRHTMIYKPNKKATLSNLDDENVTTTTVAPERSTTTSKSTTKPTKSYTTTTSTEKPTDSYTEGIDTFVRPTKRVRLRVTKPPGESLPTRPAPKSEQKPPVDPLRPIVRARVSTTTAVPSTKFTRPTRRPMKEVTTSTEMSSESYESDYNFREEEEREYQRTPIKSEDYRSYEASTSRPRGPDREAEPVYYKLVEPPRQKPYQDDERERPMVQFRVPEADDELFTRPPSFGFGARLPSKTSAETGLEPNSGVRYEEAGKNPGQQFKVSGEYIKIKHAKPDTLEPLEPPPRERPVEDSKIYFKPQPTDYEQSERIPERGNTIVPRPQQHRPSDYEEERYVDYYSSTPSSSKEYEDEVYFKTRYYPIPPVTYEPPHIEYSPPSPPPPSRVYKPPMKDYSPPAGTCCNVLFFIKFLIYLFYPNILAYYPRPAEIDLYKYPPSRPEKNEDSRGKQPSYRLVGNREPENRPQNYRPRPEETSTYRRPEEPTRTEHEVKHYRGHVAELDTVRGLAPAFETFTRLVSVGQPTIGDLSSHYERAKSQAPERHPQDHRPFRQEVGRPIAPETEKFVRHEQPRDDLRILETVLVGSPVTSTTPRTEVRPLSATERPRIPGENQQFRVLESVPIQNSRGPSTKLRPPSEPDGSYIPIPLNGRDQIKWQVNPTRDLPNEKPPERPAYNKPHSLSVQQPKPSNNPLYSHYAPLDSPFTRPNTSPRINDGRNGRLIPALDTITDDPVDYRPTQRPPAYGRFETETRFTQETSYRRPKEFNPFPETLQQYVAEDLKPDFSYKVNFKPKEPFIDQRPDYLVAEYHQPKEPHSTVYVDKKPEHSQIEIYQPKEPYPEFYEGKPEYVQEGIYRNPLPEAYVSGKQKYLQEQTYQPKDPFPEAFSEPRPEYLQTVNYQPKDPEVTAVAATLDSDVTPQGAAVKGVPGVDYPVYTEIPSNLSFKCEYVETTGYYADLETRCQVNLNNYSICINISLTVAFNC